MGFHRAAVSTSENPFCPKGIVMKTLATVFLVTLVLTNSTVCAQDRSIRFRSGSKTATVKNPLSNKSYKLSVSPKQRIAIHLTSTSSKKLVQFDIKRDRYRGKAVARH